MAATVPKPKQTDLKPSGLLFDSMSEGDDGTDGRKTLLGGLKTRAFEYCLRNRAFCCLRLPGAVHHLSRPEPLGDGFIWPISKTALNGHTMLIHGRGQDQTSEW